MKSDAFITKPYLSVLVPLLLIWSGYMQYMGLWSILPEKVIIMITMVFGSIVAGISAEGGGAVAFPVFTKLLDIAPIDARNFGLLIQSIGMGMASFVIFTKRMNVLWRVIFVVSLGGIFGQIYGAYALSLPGSTTKLLFTIISSMLGIAVFLTRWVLKMPVYNRLENWTFKHKILFTLIGFIGGCFASQTSSGIDMLSFIFLVLLFGINEKVATLSSVVIMAFNSMVGATIHAFFIQDISTFAYEAWLSAIPIVVFGAPLGTLLAARINRDTIIILLLSLIFIEFLSTLILVPIDPVFAVSVGLFCILFFAGLVYFRRRITVRDD